jgi:hypothetical protein
VRLLLLWLIPRTDTSIFIGETGAPTRNFGITWSTPPDEIAYGYPYLLAIVPAIPAASAESPSPFSNFSLSSSTSSAKMFVEIRHLTTQFLVQQIDLPNVHRLCTTSNGRGPVYVANDKNVWRLSPVSFMRQIDQLVEAKAFNEAIRLLEQLDSLAADEKARIISQKMF